MLVLVEKNVGDSTGGLCWEEVFLWGMGLFVFNLASESGVRLHKNVHSSLWLLMNEKREFPLYEMQSVNSERPSFS